MRWIGLPAQCHDVKQVFFSHVHAHVLRALKQKQRGKTQRFVHFAFELSSSRYGAAAVGATAAASAARAADRVFCVIGQLQDSLLSSS